MAKDWTAYQDSLKSFSESKGEPDWLLVNRIEALEMISEKFIPRVDRFDYRDWELFPAPVFNEEKANGNVPDFSKIGNEPLLVQEAGRTIMEQLPNELLEQGVIFTDLFTALIKYPELVKKYLFQAVPADENKLTAYHTAFLNSGLFLYVPKNVKVDLPFAAEFIVSETTPLIPHILIVGDTNAEFTYVDHFNGNNSSAPVTSIVTEVIAENGAQIHVQGMDAFAEQTLVYANRRGIAKRDAHIDWALAVMNDGNTLADFTTKLIKQGATSDAKIVALSTGDQLQGIVTKVLNLASNTTGHIHQHGAITQRGTLTFNGIGQIIKGARFADAQQETRILALSREAHGDANPILLIDENEVQAGHAASIGQVDQDDLYYLMSRGIQKEIAERLVVRGFLGTVISAFSVQSVERELVEAIERKLKRL